MKKKNIIIFICALIVVTIGLVVLLNKEALFTKKQEEKQEETKPNSKEEFTYTPVMYKICDSDNCNYLVGAMHLGDRKITMLSSQVLNAYKEMDAVAVEIDSDIGNIDLTSLLGQDSIDNIISEELKQKLINFETKHPYFLYNQYKNYKLGLLPELISSIMYLELGYLTEGVDSYFTKLAKKNNKELIEIETLESQMAFFTDYSDELYAYLIENSIDNYEKSMELTKELYDAYLEGSAVKINDILNIEDETEENIDETLLTELEKYDADMLTNRNIVMANAIEEYLAENKNVFVTVGAAHVVADDGIVAILTNKGYEITALN